MTKNTPEPFGGLRHGEILILPTTFKSRMASSEHHTFVVGHSETGHHHVLESAVPFAVTETRAHTFLKLSAEAQLVHKKETEAHATLTLPPGRYIVRRKTEYHPMSHRILPVID